MTDQVKYTNLLKNKRVLVIGGSSGIGFSVAEALVEHGSIVIVSSSNKDRVQATVDRLLSSYPSAKSRISGETVNLREEETLEEQIITLLDRSTSNGDAKLDHIVSTAGDGLAMLSLDSLDMAKVKQAGMVRFFAPLFLGKHAPNYMHPSPQSSIIFTTGAVSERPIPGWAVINSYATGLQGMTRALALDLAPVRVNLVSPGSVDTELWESSGVGAEAKKGVFERMAKGMTTGEVARPEQVAESYLYLMRDGNATGSMVSTNGGSLLLGPG